MGDDQNHQEEAGLPSRFWAIPPLLCGLAVALIVGRFEPATIAKASGNSTAAILFFVVMFWARRRETWFSVFLFSIILIHFVIIVFVPWPIAITPDGHKDIFLLFGLSDIFATFLLGLLASISVKSGL
jgi:hypothetical protein